MSGGLKAIGGVVDGNGNPSLRLMPAIEVKSGTAAAPNRGGWARGQARRSPLSFPVWGTPAWLRSDVRANISRDLTKP
jgi:hypothetical protein